ncbi:MAG: IS110 family transposase [Desulfobacteraceae bacterium]|nr:MAG: IS110 family transposase [Desulfobacteraceae bacterium]
MEKTIKYIGLDVHKDTIQVAIAEEGRKSPAMSYGNIHNTPLHIDKVIRNLKSDGTQLSVVYEAGPTGYGIYRQLKAQNIECAVAAPSLIPIKSGDRVKTDRRDAINLARLHRSGDLTEVYVPNEEDEAIRDLSRAREDAKICAKKAKQRLSSFLLRSNRIYTGKTKWNKTHLAWLSEVSMRHSAQQVALQEYIDTLKESLQRIDRLTNQIKNEIEHWRLKPVVKAIQSLRGVSMIVAVTTLAELGDINRFKKAKQLMAYLGLVPSEHSSGLKSKKGSITKTGNGHVRRVLTEAAWAYRFKPKKSLQILRRQQGIPESICDIAWKAQLRLCNKYKALSNRKVTQVAVTAVARELIGFIWAICIEMESIQENRLAA